MEPPRRPRVPCDIPGSLSLQVMHGDKAAAESVTAARHYSVPYGRSAASRAVEFAGAGMVTARRRGGEGDGGVKESRRRGMDVGEEPGLRTSGAENAKHG